MKGNKKLLLSIFNTNFDLNMKSHYTTNTTKNKNAGKSLRSLLNNSVNRQETKILKGERELDIMEDELWTPKKTNKLNLNRKKNIKKYNDLSLKSGLDLNTNFSYNSLSVKGSKGAKSVTKRPKQNYFQLPELGRSANRYDPKYDRFALFQLRRANSNSKRVDDSTPSFPSKTSRKKKDYYARGALSYSHIANKLKTDMSVPNSIKLGLKL